MNISVSHSLYYQFYSRYTLIVVIRLNGCLQEFVRDYVALTHGSLSQLRHPFNQPQGMIDFKVDKTNYERTRRCVVNNRGQPAWTLYERLAEFESQGAKYTLLHLRLITGRTHQIRVHCEHIGLPLVGDEHYRNNRQYHNPRLRCPKRPFLHKQRFMFPDRYGHPTLVRMPLEDEPDLVDTLKQMRRVA